MPYGTASAFWGRGQIVLQVESESLRHVPAAFQSAM